MSTRFDTLQAAETLAHAGFDDTQAKAIVSTMSNAVGEHAETKADMAALRTEFSDLRTDFSDLRTEFSDLRANFADLRANFADLRAEVRTEIAELKASLTWRIVIAMGVFAALVRLMP